MVSPRLCIAVLLLILMHTLWLMPPCNTFERSQISEVCEWIFSLNSHQVKVDIIFTERERVVQLQTASRGQFIALQALYDYKNMVLELYGILIQSG